MSLYNMLVSRKKIEYIAHNLIVTDHAKERIDERLGKGADIRQLILNSPLWFRNKDGCITIAINTKKCFIVAEKDNKFTLITVKDDSENDYDMMDKFVVAYSGK